MIQIYAVNIRDDLSPEQQLSAVSRMPAKKQQRWERYKREEDRRRLLFGDLLIRYLAKKKLGATDAPLSLNYGFNGKPFFPDYPSFHFNLSHSGDWVVSAIGLQEVGVDIEKILPPDLAIAEHFFSYREFLSILSKSGPAQWRQFYSYWTLKESYLKCIGKGLSLPISSIEFIECEDSYKLIGENLFIHKVLYSIPDYVFAICCKNEPIDTYMNIIRPSVCL